MKQWDVVGVVIDGTPMVRYQDVWFTLAEWARMTEGVL